MKKLTLLLLLIFLTMVTSGCLDMIFGPVEDEPPIDQGQNNNDEEDPDTSDEDSWDIVFYVVDKTSDLLVPITIKHPKQEGIAKATVEGLVLGSSLSGKIAPYGLEMPLPQRTGVLGISINHGVARVDLSQEFMSFTDKKKEVLGITSLVYTLTQFPTIESVQIVINGEIQQKMIFDTYVNVPLDRTMAINVAVSDEVDIKNTEKVIVYYPVIREGKLFFTPETKVINENENDTLEVTLKEFFKGPNNSLLVNNIPADVKVISAKIENNIAAVDLSRQFADFRSNTEKAVIDALVLTLTEIDGIEKVQLSIEGNTPVLSQGTDLDQVFSRPGFTIIQ